MPSETVAAIASKISKVMQEQKVTLTPAEHVAVFQAVRGGAAPLDSIRTVLAQRFSAAVPGTMTPAQVTAEIAARVGNRSPARD